MGVELAKSFAFSASIRRGERALGRNYILTLFVAPLDEAREKELEAAMKRDLIDAVHTRDLSDLPDFKDACVSDEALLRAIKKKLDRVLPQFSARRIELRLDGRSMLAMNL
jgi:hypothetical protein